MEDLVEIIRQRAMALQWQIESEDVLIEIAKRSKKTPRIALNRNLQMCWSVCSSQGRSIITIHIKVIPKIPTPYRLNSD